MGACSASELAMMYPFPTTEQATPTLKEKKFNARLFSSGHSVPNV